MTGSVQNNTGINNSYMKVSRPNIGVIAPPAKLCKPVLYSHVQATKEFNEFDRNLHQQIKRTKAPTKDTPKAVYVFTALAAILLSIPFLRKIIKK